MILKPYSHIKRLPFVPDGAKALQETDAGYLVSGYITTSDVDRTKEIMVTDGIRNWDEFSANPVLLYNHYDQIGHAEELRREKDRIYAVSLLAKGHDIVEKQVWPLLKAGSLRSYSIGFDAVAGHDEKGIWHHDEWDLYEHSLVSIPANPSAQAFVKALGIELSPEKQVVTVQSFDVATRWVKWEPTVDCPEAWCLGPNTKLQFVRQVDDVQLAVWDGLACATVALSGARGGAGLSDVETQKAWQMVAKYYAEFGKQMPDVGATFAETKWYNDEPKLFEDAEAAENAHRLRGLSIGIRDLKRGRSKRGGVLPATVIENVHEAHAALEDLLQPEAPTALDRLRERLIGA